MKTPPATGKRRELFGTDGVRDEANTGNMTPEFALRLGQGYVAFLRKKFPDLQKLSLCIGKDTRLSSDMIASACAAGAMSAGAEVLSLGVIPTPGVSHMIPSLECAGGIMISASHNSWEYNGIKLFSRKGEKLSDEEELRVEEEILGKTSLLERREAIGTRKALELRESSYFESFQNCLRDLPPLEKPLVVDCAHGAASLLLELGLAASERKDILCIGSDPRGTNINSQAGVMDMAPLSRKVREVGGACGMAFDGDADRVLFVDSRGRQINGDIMLWILGRWMARKDPSRAGVVATVMSNLALEEHLKESGIPLYRCPVGDRYVLEKMKETGALLGGEQSGHIIAFPHFVSGDGPRGGFLFLRACAELGEDLDTLVDRFGCYPQHLENVRVRNKERALQSRDLEEKRLRHEKNLAPHGRVFIRPSGTEPLIRILVESRDKEVIPQVVEDLKACLLASGGVQEKE
ncbi:MAG TPA: phosphoglucosamine mutase [Synergistaceae bacterium]|nr:phosphoglucosamine mutase [Synergistaceae bacterium]